MLLLLQDVLELLYMIKKDGMLGLKRGGHGLQVSTLCKWGSCKQWNTAENRIKNY